MIAQIRSMESRSRRPRYSLPSGMAQITVQLELVTDRAAGLIVGHLWDISHSGACIALPGLRQIAVPAGSRLQLRDPLTHAVHRLEAELRWCTALSHSTFVGVLFTGGPCPAETFLSAYMRTSWTDAVPSSRLNGP